jgi:hypothetical protein
MRHAMRLIVWIFVAMLSALPALGAEHERRDSGIRDLLTKHKVWVMYWEVTDAQLPTDRATKIKYEFFERDRKLMARMVVDFGGCEFEVPLRADGIELRYCGMQGEPSLTFDPSDTKYPFKERSNPRKLWLTPN